MTIFQVHYSQKTKTLARDLQSINYPVYGLSPQINLFEIFSTKHARQWQTNFSCTLIPTEVGPGLNYRQLGLAQVKQAARAGLATDQQ